MIINPDIFQKLHKHNKMKNRITNLSNEQLLSRTFNTRMKQDRQGQQELMQSFQLPAFDAKGESVEHLYIGLGILVIAPSSNDPLFFDVVLPERWKFGYTKECYYTQLLNEHEKGVGQICYMANPANRTAYFEIEPTLYNTTLLTYEEIIENQMLVNKRTI